MSVCVPREDEWCTGGAVIAGVSGPLSFVCWLVLFVVLSLPLHRLPGESKKHPAGMSTSPGATDGSQRNSLEVDAELTQRIPGAPEQDGVSTPQVKLKERQRFYEEAFQQDMEQYLSTGYLQIAERRGSMSSMEVNVDMLEQMDLMDMSDHEALDVFLHSGGEDNSAASPVAGPDVEPFTTEITLQVPTQAELRHKLSSLSSTCTDSVSQDTEAGEEDEDEEEEDMERGGRRRRTLDEDPDTVLANRVEHKSESSKDCGGSKAKV